MEAIETAGSSQLLIFGFVVRESGPTLSSFCRPPLLNTVGAQFWVSNLNKCRGAGATLLTSYSDIKEERCGCSGSELERFCTFCFADLLI
jgi:hypothetical protein